MVKFTLCIIFLNFVLQIETLVSGMNKQIFCQNCVKKVIISFTQNLYLFLGEIMLFKVCLCKFSLLTTVIYF